MWWLKVSSESKRTPRSRTTWEKDIVGNYHYHLRVDLVAKQAGSAVIVNIMGPPNYSPTSYSSSWCTDVSTASESMNSLAPLDMSSASCVPQAPATHRWLAGNNTFPPIVKEFGRFQRPVGQSICSDVCGSGVIHVIATNVKLKVLCLKMLIFKATINTTRIH